MPRQSKGTRTNRRTKPDKAPAKFEPGFLLRLDQRTELARVLRDRYDAVAADLGGEDELSTIKAGLVERYVWLESIIQGTEHQLALIQQGDDPAAAARAGGELVSRWIQAVNALLGIGKTLGIERRMANDPWMALKSTPPPTAPVEPKHED